MSRPRAIPGGFSSSDFEAMVLTLVVYTAQAGSSSEEALKFLASWAATIAAVDLGESVRDGPSRHADQRAPHYAGAHLLYP